MDQSTKNRRRERRIKLTVLVAALAFALILFMLLWRAWLEGLSGCAMVMQDAEYSDTDESRMTPEFSESAEPYTFTDGDYDAVFPDLKETED